MSRQDETISKTFRTPSTHLTDRISLDSRLRKHIEANLQQATLILPRTVYRAKVEVTTEKRLSFAACATEGSAVFEPKE